MNGKQAKRLRKPALYRNQTATPGRMDFPGIARLVAQPVYSSRVTDKTSYVFLPLDAKPTKVVTPVRRMVLDNRAKPILAFEKNPEFGKPITRPEQVVNDEGATVTVQVPTGLIDRNPYRIQTQAVPVSKPGRLRSAEPKGVYRALKRLHKRRMLVQVGAVAERLLAAA